MIPTSRSPKILANSLFFARFLSENVATTRANVGDGTEDLAENTTFAPERNVGETGRRQGKERKAGRLRLRIFQRGSSSLVPVGGDNDVTIFGTFFRS